MRRVLLPLLVVTAVLIAGCSQPTVPEETPSVTLGEQPPAGGTAYDVVILGPADEPVASADVAPRVFRDEPSIVEALELEVPVAIAARSPGMGDQVTVAICVAGAAESGAGLEIYAEVQEEWYSAAGGKLTPLGGGVYPVRIRLTRVGDGFHVDGVDKAKDGSEYLASLDEMLPGWVRDRVDTEQARSRLDQAVQVEALQSATGIPQPVSYGAAADTPEGLEDLVSSMARSEDMGTVASARYVATTISAASALLGKSMIQQVEGDLDHVFLVELHGSFSPRDIGQGSGPYLAFVYWHAGNSALASDYTVLQEPLPLDSVGAPRTLEPFALAHPGLDRAWGVIWGLLYRCLAPILLVACAILCVWRRHAKWPYALAVCVALAVAGLQIAVMLGSLQGRSWDQLFHGIKVGVLVAVVGIDLAAAGFALRELLRRTVSGQDSPDRPRWLSASVVLLAVAAALYLPALFIVGSTGE